MPIYIGDKEIATVFKGDTELDNIQLGDQQQWIGIIVTPDPTITILSTTQTTITIRLTNTHTEEVTIFYEANDTTPDQYSVSVAASSFVDRTITGLSIGSAQTIYAYALQTEQLPSTVVSLATSTLAQAAPTISNISKTINSITFRVRNNNSEQSIVRARLNANPTSSSSPAVTLNPGVTSGNLTFPSLSSSTNYSLRAASFINNISGPVATSSVTTLTPPPFYDVSNSPGAKTPLFSDSTLNVAYYGTVPASSLYTLTGLRSAVNYTPGSAGNQFEGGLENRVWHKYWWNNGVHFFSGVQGWSLSFNSLLNAGLVYGTGTTTSRKGNSSLTSVPQNKTVTKNGVTYKLRIPESSSQFDPATSGSNLFVPNGTGQYNLSEWNVVFLNLLSNSCGQSSVTFPWNNGSYTQHLQWNTGIERVDINALYNSSGTYGGTIGVIFQEAYGSGFLRSGSSNNCSSFFSAQYTGGRSTTYSNIGWLPILSVSHPSYNW